MESSPAAPPTAADFRGQFSLGTSLFLRVLAAIHLIAFASLWTQLAGLIGPHGILPASNLLRAAHEQLGSAAYPRLPTLCWLFGADTFLTVLCAAGIGFALLLFAGIAPALCLAALWACYLSLVNVGQEFLGFQWDALLLETTLLAIWIAPWTLGARPPPVAPASLQPPRVARWLLAWLLFRLMFLSGIVKLTSGDSTWRDLSALAFHFETQPLPTPLAVWAHHLSASLQRAACAGMFAIELLAPFFVFGPRSIRHNAALLLLTLQLAIALTGNYTFFNLLTAALCLPLLDDAWWRRLPLLRANAQCNLIGYTVPPPARWRRWSLAGFAALVFAYTSLLALPSIFRGATLPRWFGPIVSVVAPFNSFNNYGLFAVMTTTRPELVIEGSDDAREWRAYELPHKPGDLARRPDFVAPHQPRLDWQLWFAALSPPEQNRWMLPLCEHLLRGTPDVLALFAHNPFPARPPRFIRVVRYDYHFTNAAERARTGRWWRRTPLDYYIPAVSLR
jgi:hypothetical protein